MIFHLVFCLFVFLPMPLYGSTMEELPNQYLQQLDVKSMSQVEAKVVVADYSLLRQDFPFLSELSDEAIDQWLLDKAAFVRDSQIELGEKRGIHGAIKTRTPHRRMYGFASSMTKRSVIMPFRSPAPYRSTPSIDLKGSGADDPQRSDFHQNGVLRLDEALREFYMTKIVRQISRVVTAEESFDVVDAYAVIRIPTWHTYSHHETGAFLWDGCPPEVLRNSPASRLDLSILVRQTARRSLTFNAYFAPAAFQRQFEEILYAFNMTSLSTLYDVIYRTWSQPGVHEFLFFDVQTAASELTKQAVIDFNLVRFLSPKEAALFENKPVYLLQNLYETEKNGYTGCVSWDRKDQKVKSLNECREYLLGLDPLWHVPSTPTSLSSTYDLGIQYTNWTDLQYDFTALFPSSEQQEISSFQSMGLFHALDLNPQFCQRIFDHLIAALNQWPLLTEKISHSV